MTQSITKSIDQIRTILEKEIEDRLNKGRDKPLTPKERDKKLRLNHKKYPILSMDKYRTLDDDLIIYRDVYLKNGKPKRLGEPFLQLVEERFARIKVTSHRSKEHLKPDFMQVKNKGDKRMEEGDDQWYRQRDSELRSLRRSLDRTKKTLISVQEGKFPS